MTSSKATSIDIPGSPMAEYIIDHRIRQDAKDSNSQKSSGESGEKSKGGESTICDIKVENDTTHRRLKSRHIQLIGIGGTIGTALFVTVGKGLVHGGPASLFMAFTIWCTFIIMATDCMSEMVTYNPISSPFIRFAGRYVDEAYGVAAGYNFFIFEATLIPFEIVACNLIIHFWSDVIPGAAMISILIVCYALINLFGVKYYGEIEFWLAIGKVLLIIGLLLFTLVAMLGGNPLNDRYGFRYWRDPGSFAEYYTTGTTGRWMGFLACLIQAAFTVAGPEYVSMAAGEAENPRKVMPKAFKAVIWRLTFFFVFGCLAVGINVPYNDPNLIAAYADGSPGAAASPYVVAMTRLQIPILPHITNAVLLLSAFSAGNSYVYCASRSLYGLALERKAPRFLTKCAPNGVPIYCVIAVLIFALLSFLQVSNSAAVVLGWFVNLVTASQLINFTVIAVSFIAWKRACDAQGLDRKTLPYMSKYQPFQAYIVLFTTGVMTFIGGYEVFLPGNWNIPTFLFSYCSVFAFPVVYLGWKFWHKTKILKPTEVILRTFEVEEIEKYTEEFVEPPPRKNLTGFWGKIIE